MYIIVENAGYEGEHDVYSTRAYRDAIYWVTQNYTNDERDELHVAVCRITSSGERSYDL